jgi:hypothetical protein
LGAPTETGEYRDALGRTWIMADWVIGFNNEVLIMFILPLPDGPAVITTIQDSTELDVYKWDLKKTCDHIHIIYSASFSGWSDYLKMKNYVPDILKDFRFTWQKDSQSVSFSTGGISITADNNVFDWADTSELYLAPSWYKVGNNLQYGVRQFIMYRDVRGKEYSILAKRIKPDERMGSGSAESWNDLVAEKYPFDGKAAISVKDNTGSDGAILKADRPNDDVRYSLYLSMENPNDEDSLNRRFNALRSGIKITE